MSFIEIFLFFIVGIYSYKIFLYSSVLIDYNFIMMNLLIPLYFLWQMGYLEMYYIIFTYLGIFSLSFLLVSILIL